MRKLKMPPHRTNGLLITFCGLDGCGKTTMIRRLASDLEKNATLFLTRQPTSFVRNAEIFRTYMDSPDHKAFDYRSLSLLAASDRLQHVNKTILPALEAGNIVISDRYFYSCLANLYARGYESDKWIFDIAKSIVQPDIAFFLDVPVETAVARVRSRAEEKDNYIDMALQHRLRKEYWAICKANGGVYVDSSGAEEETYKQILAIVERKALQI
mgnify:CR=1 FL=1